MSWSVPILNDINGVLTHYTVTYFGEEIDTTVRIIQVNTSSHEDMNLTLTNLEEYAIYSVNVSVYTKVGRGPDVLVYQRTLQDGLFTFSIPNFFSKTIAITHVSLTLSLMYSSLFM